MVGGCLAACGVWQAGPVMEGPGEKAQTQASHLSNTT